MRRLLLVAALAACAGGSPADAQSFRRGGAADTTPCVLDKCVGGSGTAAGAVGDAPLRPSPSRGPTTLAPGTFDFYVLALSWSPGFCDTDGAGKGGRQCEPGANDGFVVHGLWPQNTRGYPRDCESAARPTRLQLQAAADVYPSVGLAVHEWRTHGTCTGLSPTDYFAAVRRARAAVTIPDAFTRPDEPRTVAPADVVRAFAAANPGLRADTMAVTCRAGELAEVRLCVTKDLRGFSPCPEVARATCRSPAISVLPVP